MLCPKCGAPTRTLSTRALLSGLINRRRRECFNEHRFNTFEFDDALEGTIMKYAGTAEREAALTKKRQMYERDRAIVRMINDGVPFKAIGDKHGLAVNSICHIAKKAGLPRRRQSKKVLQR